MSDDTDHPREAHDLIRVAMDQDWSFARVLRAARTLPCFQQVKFFSWCWSVVETRSPSNGHRPSPKL